MQILIKIVCVWVYFHRSREWHGEIEEQICYCVIVSCNVSTNLCLILHSLWNDFIKMSKKTKSKAWNPTTCWYKMENMRTERSTLESQSQLVKYAAFVCIAPQ